MSVWKFTFNEIFQIGAVFLWSYVYNIVRISSRRIEEKQNSIDQVPKLESTVDCTKLIPGNCTNVKDIETSSALVTCKDDCEITQPLSAGYSTKKKVVFSFFSI